MLLSTAVLLKASPITSFRPSVRTLILLIQMSVGLHGELRQEKIN